MNLLYEPPMQFYSQYGEDRLLWDYFEKKNTGNCVEVGGFDGVTGSNSLFFEEHGWKAVIVEPMPQFVEKIRKRRPQTCLFECAAGDHRGEITLAIAHGAEAFSTTREDQQHMDRVHRVQATLERIVVPLRTLDELLAEARISTVDFITIDVEGAEDAVLAGFDLARWRPRIVILENNSGRFATGMHRQMLRRCYHHFRRTGCNDWYVTEEDVNVVTAGLRLHNAMTRSVFQVIETVQKPLAYLWRESGLKAWNHRRIRARREAKRMASHCN